MKAKGIVYTRRKFLTLGTLALGGALAAYLNLPETEDYDYLYESYLLSAGNQRKIDVIGRDILLVGDSMAVYWDMPGADKVGMGGQFVDTLEERTREETSRLRYNKVICFAGTAESATRDPVTISKKLEV